MGEVHWLTYEILTIFKYVLLELIYSPPQEICCGMKAENYYSSQMELRRSTKFETWLVAELLIFNPHSHGGIAAWLLLERYNLNRNSYSCITCRG